MLKKLLSNVMKQIFIMIVIFIISIEIVNGQNSEPNRRYFSYNSQDSVLLSLLLDDFKQTEFLLGFQWGSSRNTAPTQTFLHFGELK